jgi:hypothetical protein
MAYLGSTPARAPLSSAQIEDGTIDTADLATNAVTTAKITAANVTTAKIADANVTAAKVSSDVAQLGKNLIHNGAFTVAQRGTVTDIGGSGDDQILDRWLFVSGGGGTGRVTASQDALSVANRAVTGQGYALKIDCTTAESAVAASEAMWLTQRIEAQNLQGLKYGNAAAETVTLSFYYSSPKTGAHFVAAKQDDGTDTYIREFTIAVADTLEFFQVTFPGDSTGTIDNNSGAGFSITFPIISGSTYNGTKDTWTGSSSQYNTSDQQNLLDNTANNIYITGVQLEVGTVATDFEHEDYGTTLTKCLRYFWRWTGDADNDAPGLIHTVTTNRGVSEFQGVPMRAAPTVSLGGTVPDMPDATGGTVVSLNATQDDQNFGNHMIHWVLSSATADESSRLRFATADTDYIQWSAEL